MIGLVALVLVTVGIDAADHHDNLSQSIAGRLLFGEEDGPCPDGMVFVPSESGGFCIDEYEASPGKDCVYARTENQLETRDNLDAPGCIPESAKGRTPWRFVSQAQAMTACAKAGKRLPTPEEWYLASLATPDKESGWTEQDCQTNNNWDAQPGLTGSGELCRSAHGVYDMVGNVWEWVRGEIKDGMINGQELPAAGYVNNVDSAGYPLATGGQGDPNYHNDYLWIKDTESRGIARGGYWDNGEQAGVNSSYMVVKPNFAGAGIGFRCAK